MIVFNPHNNFAAIFENRHMKSRLQRTVVLLLLIAVVLAAGCSFETLEIGLVQSEAMTVEQGQAQTAEVDIFMGTGSLNLDGGASNLMDGTFEYNVADWRPEVQYAVEDSIGRLSVSQPEYKNSLPTNLGDIHYEWDIHLNEAVPMNLTVTLGAGEGNLNLSNLLLDGLEFKGGAGAVNIDLHSSSADDLDVALGAGDVVLDLSGEWLQDLRATIKGGLGRVTLILPRDSDVRITTRGLLSKISAPDLTNDSGVYTNDGYGQSDISMDIDIESGIGEIVMELGD